MMTDQVATIRIVRGLVSSESEIDRALASMAGLLSTIAVASIDSGAAAATGQIAIMRMTRSLAALTDARKELIQAHSELRKIGEVRSDIVWPDECQKASVEQFETRGIAVAA